MKVLIFGNSGSGKSTHAHALAATHCVPHLDLDSIVWVPGQVAVQRPMAEIRASLESFLATHSEWVIEGCYGELVELAAPQCSELVFLNPGESVCLANNLNRPWEPHKYSSSEEQDAMLSALQSWVSGYYTRTDPWSYTYHRRIFDSHQGPKVEHMSMPPLGSPGRGLRPRTNDGRQAARGGTTS